MVNPVNLLGVPGAGLALEFRKRCPEYVEIYRAACRNNSLRIGTVQVIDNSLLPNSAVDYDILNLPTKRHYADPSSLNDLSRGLEALAKLLNEDKYKYSTVCLPMLGCGCGKQDYLFVEPLMDDHLGKLEATVILCMNPDRTPLRPKYLAIAGPWDYGNDSTSQGNIDWVIEKTIEHWGITLSDYTGIITSGYPGTDKYLSGTTFLQDFEDSYIFKKTGKHPLIIKPNEVRHAVGATAFTAKTLVELADDIILFKPKGTDYDRMCIIQSETESANETLHNNGCPLKRVSIFGDKSLHHTRENVVISVTGSDDYSDIIPY